MPKKSIKSKLESIFPADRISDAPNVIAEHSEDITEIEPGQADIVVYPVSTEEVQALVKLALKEKTPLVPMMARTNIGGLTIPKQGGIAVDFSRMNRILEVNDREMYAIVEPGVTFGQIREHLDTYYPDLRYGYALAPPDTSIGLNCLMDGLGNLSYKNGQMSQWITGLEAVLASGEIIKAGSAALSHYWFARCPLPDVIGLFVNFFGSTGIVTKLGVEVWPKHPYRHRAFIPVYTAEGAFELMRRLARQELADDIGSLSWPTGKMLFGETNPTYRDPNEPEFFVYLDFSGESKAELKLKNQASTDVVKQLSRQGVPIEEPIAMDDLISVEPSFKQFADFPTRLTFLLDHPGGGMSWVGTYGPVSQLTEGYRRAEKIMADYGFAPTVVVRPMRGGHFAVERYITLFDKKNPEDVERVRKVNAEIVDMAVELGFIPYKTPDWVVERIKDKLDPQFVKLVSDIKKLMDPHGILNPGRWGV